ncbi:MAG: DUF2905 domain-containing protein [Dehalococcoidia bacterium]|nr:DUF2905 domain-containing protein [Dehalococcoidia bacterium]MDW8119175.1 DUF2905 domain-containing protein [Chloroflexota bacterium]
MASLEPLARLLLLAGIALVVFGGLLYLVAKGGVPFVGRLPGDFFVQKGRFTFYFPLATSLLVSLLLTLVLTLVVRFLAR